MNKFDIIPRINTTLNKTELENKLTENLDFLNKDNKINEEEQSVESNFSSKLTPEEV